MSIPVNSLCVECLFRKRLSMARNIGSEEQAMELAHKMMDEFLKAPAEMDSTWMGAICDRMMQDMYGIDADRLKAEKDFSNQFVLERLPQIQSRVVAAEDPVYAALQFAVLGNYLDFSALHGEVSFDALDKMLDEAQNIDLDRDSYGKFCRDLAEKKTLLYLADNAGEIVFDRVLAETLKKKYTHLEITFCVRGEPVSNDATREDAAVAGITFPVIDNGCAIGGTVLHFVGQELKEAMANADVIIAKGMGNAESLFGCGYNVYYAFLVKCERFIEFFNKPKLTPMFINDRQ